MDYAALELLLDEILHSDMSIERDDLHARIAASLPAHLDFHILLVERRRFAVAGHDLETDDLYLPFMSFGFQDGRVHTFDGPKEVADFVTAAEAENQILWRKPKTIAVTNHGNLEDLRSIRLTEQILLTYYYACGHYENFMANASRRFVKSFLKQQRSLTTEQVMAAITENAGCEIVYLEYEIADDAPRVRHDPTDAYGRLIKSDRFRNDLNRAVKKKGTFSGTTKDGYTYVVNVAALDRGYEALLDVEQNTSSAALALTSKRHVLVLCRKGSPIPMDAIKFGPHLFHLHLANDAFSARERLIFEIYSGVADVERRFTASPPTSRAEIDKITHDHFEQILKAAAGVTAAELLIVRTFDPFGKSLKPVTAVRGGNSVAPDGFPALSAHGRDAVVRSFLTGRAVALATPADYVSIRNPRGPEECIGFSFPLRIGCLTRGVLECYSSRRAQLQFDEDYLRAIADAIGDAAHRIEAAADVAWLSRLSFLHSARHELENFLPLLAQKDKALHSSLRSTLERYSGVGPSPWRQDQRGLAAQAQELLGGADDGQAAVQALVEQIDTVESVLQPDDGFRFIFSEVLSTLVSNATKHSTLRASDFRFDFAETQAESAGLSITYRTSDKRIRPKRAERVATAPIPDVQHTSFHYGLFLVAAQVRMNGGAAVMHTDLEAELDTIPFEICFTLPLYPLSSTDAD